MSSPSRRLVLVRHAESLWNRVGRWQGQSGSGLTDEGHAQAEVTAARVAAAYPDTALVVRSDLERVQQTAEPLVALTGALEVVDRRLREIDVAAWSGKTNAEIREVDPDRWSAFVAGEDVALGGGERHSDVRRRVADALGDLLARPQVAEGRTTVVVTHAGPLRAAVACLLGLASGRELPGAGNGSLSVLEERSGAWELVCYDDREHLEAAGRSTASRSMQDSRA